jgi:aspartyl-tRNA(Asn)/glutamyl-tRNA(Gln) amidotransferase subunit A
MTAHSDLAALTLADAAARLAARDTTSLALTESVLAQIDATEPTVHAYTRVYADAALDTARSLDAELEGGRRRGPLHGIPIAVKDLCHVAGWPTEAGSRVLAGEIAAEDSTVVHRLRAAGAVIVGKTHTPEFAWTHSPIPTRNPWGDDHYPGGSSAGSAVAVAARSAFGAVGTDTGGSIRIPAALSGVVGLKPTFGRVSRAGVIAMSSTLDHVGPLTRTAEDAALMLQAMAGHDPLDPTSARVAVPEYRRALTGDVTGLRLGVERSYFWYERVTDEVAAAAERAIDELAGRGAKIVEIELPELAYAPDIAVPIVLAETSAYHRRWLRERGDLYHPATRFMLTLGELLPATAYLHAHKARERLRTLVREAFEDHRLDALVAPALPGTSLPVADVESSDGGLTETADHPFGTFVHHSFPGNLTGQPTVTVPCGLSSAGLPVGLQIMARPFDEAMALRIGDAYQQMTDWHRLAPPLAVKESSPHAH